MDSKIQKRTRRNELQKNVQRSQEKSSNIRFEDNINLVYSRKYYVNDKSRESDSDNEISSDNEELNVPKFINDYKDDSKEKETSSRIIILVCVLVIIFILGLVYLAWFYYSPSSFGSYSEEFNKIMNKFPSQTKISWKILNNTLAKQILRHQPINKPSVIILVGRHERVDLFLATLIEHVIRKCPTYKQPIETENADDLKSDLSLFLSNLVGEETHCAYLPEIDNLHPSLGPLLHGLTDELNATYKEMVYIFSWIINHNNEKSALPPKTDEDAEKLLKNQLSLKWEYEQGTERFVALHTRLLVNVVNIM